MRVNELPGLDLRRLAAYLGQRGYDSGPLTAGLIEGGRSNVTYWIRGPRADWVLRRPPLGHVLATAHDMAREYRVISALSGTAVPVPRPVLLCEDPTVLGAPFYLMQRVAGTVYRSPSQTGALSRDQRTRLARTLIETLALLHRTDPAAVGLSKFGRPDGFLARQVRRWGTQLAASRSRELPGIDQLAARLAATVPPSGAAAIVHGDYRLDNVLVRDDAVAAVLDWEMSTLGDPLTDLGLLLVYWDGPPAGADNPAPAGVGPRHGFPPGHVLTSWYADRTGADLSHLAWYEALGSFKLAAILEGIHFRYQQGLTVGTGFDRVGVLVPPLVAHGLAALDRHAAAHPARPGG